MVLNLRDLASPSYLSTDASIILLVKTADELEINVVKSQRNVIPVEFEA